MHTVNRMAAVVTPKGPYFAWSESVLGDELPPDNPDDFRTVFLLAESNDIEQSLRKVFAIIFDEMLSASVNFSELWPDMRDLKTFRKWFDVQLIEIVHDVGRDDLLHDEP